MEVCRLGRNSKRRYRVT